MLQRPYEHRAQNLQQDASFKLYMVSTTQALNSLYGTGAWWHLPAKSFTICRVTPCYSCSLQRFSSFSPWLICASGTGAHSLDSRAPWLLVSVLGGGPLAAEFNRLLQGGLFLVKRGSLYAQLLILGI